MTAIGIGIGVPFARGGGDGQNRALNIPTLVVQEGGVDTHAEDEGADLMALVTVDDGDGGTTSDVELYVNGTLISSMVDDGGGDWSLAVVDVTPGTKNYRAKRITDLGFRWSATWQVVVAPEAPSLDAPVTSTVTIGDTVDFEATGTVDGFDANTTKIDFLVDGVVVATALTDTAGVWEASWDTTGAEEAADLPVIARRYFAGGTIDSVDVVELTLEEDAGVAPVLDTAETDTTGEELTLTYDQALDETSEPDPSDFALGGTSAEVDTVNVTGMTVVLTLDPAILFGETVTLDYTAGAAPIQNAGGQDAANLTDEPVTNNAVDVAAPTLSTAIINAAGTSLTLTYNEALDDTSEPAVGAFSLAGALISAITAVNVTGSTVVLTLSPAVGSTETGITLDYTAGGSPIQDLAGNDAANLNDQAVTNNSAHAFTPTDIPGLKGWFDMQDAGSYTQAGTVTSITNKASAVAWTEATVPPPYNATGLNGHPAMVPTGTQRIISTEAALLALFANVASRTVGFVGSVTVADSTRSFFGAGRSDSADSSVRLGTNTTGAGRWTHVTRNAAATTTTSDSAGGSDTNNHVFIWTRDATTASLQTDNAAADPSGSAHATGTTTPTRMALCARPNSAIDTHWIGNWGELVIYDSVLSAGQIVALHDYLSAKWL